ncbi:MAG: NUDIX domain-containing protein [Planctomycetia bacterium]|jgi:8-oxo-dGTP diphosphatase
MSTKPFTLSAKAIILDDKQRVLLLQRSLGATYQAGLWELPGGKIDSGENFAAALVREVKEETELIVELDRVAGAGEWDGHSSFRIVYVFMTAHIVSGKIQLSSEHEQYRWAARDDLLQLELCSQFREIVETYCPENY